MTAQEEHNLDVIRRYLKAIEDDSGAADFFTEDVVQIEHPNRFVPEGATRGLAELEQAAERGRKVLRRQRYEEKSALASGDRVALEVLWIGTLAVPVGSIPAGGEMRAHFGVFFELRDGRICRQVNYDCFEPF
jgi:ketosteroid isomerase-like protein